MPSRKSENIEELKRLMKAIKEKNLLPRGYGQIIADKLKIDRNEVYQTLRGQTSKIDIMEAIIDIAASNKELQLIEKAKKVLED